MHLLVIIVCGGAAILIWLLWAFQAALLPLLGVEWEPTRLGLWGDTFGALNTLFGAFGLSAVLWTIWQQNRAINNQQRDLHRQQFDSTFFQLLAFLRESRSEMKYRTVAGGQMLQGPEAFQEAALEAISLLLEQMNSSDRAMSKVEIGAFYRSRTHSRSEEFLGPYFRLVFTILRRVHDDEILADEEKVAYGNIVRSQLGASEAGLLVLNGLMKESGNLAYYIEHFRLLRYLPQGPIKILAQKHYTNQAFEARND